MKLQYLTTQNYAAICDTILEYTEWTLEVEDGDYFLRDHPDTSDQKLYVETVQDVILFAYSQGKIDGIRKQQAEIRSVLGV